MFNKYRSDNECSLNKAHRQYSFTEIKRGHLRSVNTESNELTFYYCTHPYINCTQEMKSILPESQLHGVG